MNEFADESTEVPGAAPHRRVSSGLNLALPLRDPTEWRRLLNDIQAAESRIKRAMDALSFVHFARFVPSWDGRALMVITEFDGPMEPYVMDFAIALDDVFDTLLGYVRENARPPLPIRDHPEDFWAFVQQWNRLPLGPREDGVFLPDGRDFPMYASYPTKTVIDIVGRRDRLPPPVTDAPAARVDLDDVQGNILSGYRARQALHMFFSVADGAAARTWLSTAFRRTGTDSTDVDGFVLTRATRWVVAPKSMINVAFTHAGLRALLPGRAADLERFPTAFREGAQARSDGNGDIGDSAPGQWRFGRDDQHIHVVISVYVKHGDGGAATDALVPASMADAPAMAPVAGLLAAAGSNGLTLFGHQVAQALPGDKEHFGYRDGISKVRISGQCKPDEPDFQPAASPGEFLLGAGYASVFGGPSLGDLPADLAQNGTFGVMRLLEQDVDRFNLTIAREAERLGISDSWLKAQILGRWPEGHPLALDPTTRTPAPGPNAFDYAPSWEHPDVPDDHDGVRCPVGAHIRRVNPRTAHVAGQRHSRRLIRRGMPASWTEGEARRQGLLGLFIGASIERQFEFIQRQWIHGDLAASGLRGTHDPIAAQRQEAGDFRLPTGATVSIPPWVQVRGSLYLFFPGVSALHGLDAADAATSRPARDAAPARPAGDPPLSAQALEFIRDAAVARLFDDDAIVDQVVTNFLPHRSDVPPPDGPLAPGELSPLNPRFIADPCTFYADLRRSKASVLWVPPYRAWWVLTRPEVERVLNRHDEFLQLPGLEVPRGILTMEEPRHREAIQAVRDAFREATVDLEAWTHEAIDATFGRLGDLGRFDAVRDYGMAVPKAVYWRVFGLRDEEVRIVDPLAQAMMRSYKQPPRPGMNDDAVFKDAAMRLAMLLRKSLEQEIIRGLDGRPSAGLIGGIARRTSIAGTRERPLRFDEALTTLTQLALVHMSAQFLLGTAVRNLLTPDPRVAPSQPLPWARLAAMAAGDRKAFDAALARALEEARRIDAPVTLVERFAAHALSIGGVAIAQYAPVFALVASANRDLPAHERAEEFHWDREPGEWHFSLGRGIHQCAGQELQERMLGIALGRLIEAMPGLRLGDATAVPAWLDNIYFRALDGLTVTRCA